MSSYGLKKMYIVSKNGVLNSLIYWRNAVKAIYQERFASNLKLKNKYQWPMKIQKTVN